MPENRVRLEIDGPIAVIVNANPDRHNAFDDSMDARLFELLAQLKEMPEFAQSSGEPRVNLGRQVETCVRSVDTRSLSPTTNSCAGGDLARSRSSTCKHP